VISSPRPVSLPVAAVALGLVVWKASPAPAATPTAQEALLLKPRQPDVDCDRPTNDEAETATIKQETFEGFSALVVRTADGRILRVFADTNGDRVTDRWSFFKDGSEVFREIDGPDRDWKSDQCRWFNAGGSRWGLDPDGDGTLDAWKTISAEEATAEIVKALAQKETGIFARLLPTKAELQAAGFTGERLDDLTRRVTAARTDFLRLAATQTLIGPDAVWTSMRTLRGPGLLPAGSPGLAREVMAYESVVALADSAGGPVEVIVGTLIRCGDAWRPIEAPRLPGRPAGDDAEAAATTGFVSPDGKPIQSPTTPP
jgi:hypothetical protein